MIILFGIGMFICGFFASWVVCRELMLSAMSRDTLASFRKDIEIRLKERPRG